MTFDRVLEVHGTFRSAMHLGRDLKCQHALVCTVATLGMDVPMAGKKPKAL